MHLLKKTDVQLNKRYINNEDNDVNYLNHLEIYNDKDDNGDDNSDNNENQTMNAYITLHIYMEGF